MNRRIIARGFLFSALLLPSLGVAQLAVNVSPPKVSGEKAVVSIRMVNGFSERVEAARAAVFVLDEQGKVAGHTTQWVVGGGKDKSGLPPGATNYFNFVVTPSKPFTTTNLTVKLSFSRLVLEGGKLADAAKQVLVEQEGR